MTPTELENRLRAIESDIASLKGPAAPFVPDPHGNCDHSIQHCVEAEQPTSDLADFAKSLCVRIDVCLRSDRELIAARAVEMFVMGATSKLVLENARLQQQADLVTMVAVERDGAQVECAKLREAIDALTNSSGYRSRIVNLVTRWERDRRIG